MTKSIKKPDAWLELKVPPLILVLILAVSGWILRGMSRSLTPDHVLNHWFAFSGWLPGLCLVSLGVLLCAAGVRDFRRARTTVNPLNPEQSSELVMSGVYRYTRNPMYLGFLMVLLGWGLILQHLVPLILALLFVPYIQRYQIRPEERALRDRFGTAFEHYQKRVRRWI